MAKTYILPNPIRDFDFDSSEKFEVQLYFGLFTDESELILRSMKFVDIVEIWFKIFNCEQMATILKHTCIWLTPKNDSK